MFASVDEIWLLTSSDVSTYPNADKVFSKISIEEAAEVYRSCDVLVKLSYVEGMFGPPLEIFHCGGTAIVYAVTGYDEYIQHDYNALVAEPDDEDAVINYLKTLKTDKQLLARLQNNAKITAAAWLDWQPASQNFMQMLEEASLKSPTSVQISNAIRELFSQQISIKTSNDQETHTQEIYAQDLYDNGHYMLRIPLLLGKSSSTIYFGKSYKEFKLINITFPEAFDNAIEGNINVGIKDMLPQANQSFKCMSKDAELTLHTNIARPPETDVAECYVNLQYSVIS